MVWVFSWHLAVLPQTLTLAWLHAPRCSQIWASVFLHLAAWPLGSDDPEWKEFSCILEIWLKHSASIHRSFLLFISLFSGAFPVSLSPKKCICKFFLKFTTFQMFYCILFMRVRTNLALIFQHIHEPVSVSRQWLTHFHALNGWNGVRLAVRAGFIYIRNVQRKTSDGNSQLSCFRFLCS